VHKATGRIVNVDEKAALRRAVLKPGMVRAVQLNQFAEAVAPVSRLIDVYLSS
jgi:hypothetical protein